LLGRESELGVGCHGWSLIPLERSTFEKWEEK
jgi:hypothetical protein